MTKGQKTALDYLSYGLNPVPVSTYKEPIRDNWISEITKKEILNYSFDDIGICTGIISGGLEAIDFDLNKAKDPEKIMKMFKEKVPLEILQKLVVQTTMSGGFHMIYRCEDISSSKHLANNEEGKAVIETRGEGGFIKCSPSKGYKLIQGSFDNIPILTSIERLKLFISAKMLNATLQKEVKKKRTFEDNEYIKKFPDYNENIDIGIDLLLTHGWTKHSEDVDWINFSRPDSISNDLHAGYHKEGKFFYCFSTAQDVFEIERPYNNHALFAELECNGDYRKAYGKLYDAGYGDEKERNIKQTKEEVEEENWEVQLEDISFLSDDIEENAYLEQARKNEIEQGLTTGWKSLDEYMRFKRNSFNMGIGYDGVGKSVAMLSLATASNVVHNWKWGMIMPENRTAMSRRRLIECASGKYINQFNNNPDLFEQYKKESRDNFKIISNKKHYSIADVIEMGKRLYEYYGIDAFLIDPYNFFKVTGNGYNFNNEMLSMLRVFSEEYCSVWVMAHPNSESTRTNRDEHGYLKAPSRYHIQGGADFPYRVDDFFAVHRIVNHEDEDIRRTMQIIMEKVKEEETGGKRHNSGEWTELIWETRDSFLGYWDDYGNNPMYKKMKSQQNIQKESLIRIKPEDAF